MYAGQIMEQAETYDLFDHTGHPYTCGLLRSIPSLSENPKRLYTIEGVVPNLLRLPKGCLFCNRCEEAVEKCFTERPNLYGVESTADSSCGIHAVRCFQYAGEVEADGR